MVRAPCCEKMGLKKGPWSPEEDETLVSFIDKNGHGNWRALPKQAGLLRCGKSCRLRWTNYLRPDIKRGNFSQEEEEAIIKLHEMLGNRWSAIAARLPGRTDNEIKNVWHTNIKKKLKNYQPLNSKRHISSVPRNNFKENNSVEATIVQGNGNGGLREEHVSPERSSSELSSVTDASARNGNTNGEEMNHDEMNSSEYQPQIDESFWSEQSCSEISSSGKESAYVNPLANYDLFLVKQEEMDSSKFIRHKECGFREQVSPPDEPIIEGDLQILKGEPDFEFPPTSIIEDDNVCRGKAEDDMDFWFNLFIRAEDLPDLPEF